jgi:cytochrome P450
MSMPLNDQTMCNTKNVLFTASSALAYCTYILATNIDEQKKLQLEIDIGWSDDDHQMYDHLNSSFSYLDLFIQEVLRIFPIGNIACTRRCLVDTQVCGIPIKKGILIESIIVT